MARGKGFKVTTRDRGAKAFYKNVDAMKRNKAYVKIGFLESRSEAKEGRDGEATGLTVAQVAAFHEFGTDTVPQRSFMRSTMKQQRTAINAMVKRWKPRMLEPAAVRRSLSVIGEFIQGQMQRKIQTGDPKWKELRDKTIAAKKSSRPLIDTGQMVQSIRYEVVDNT